MIELLLNRGDGYTFVRWYYRQHEVPLREELIIGRNAVRLYLSPFQSSLFRELLLRRPDIFENPEGILRMLPETVTE